jgi:hypothetical protein
MNCCVRFTKIGSIVAGLFCLSLALISGCGSSTPEDQTPRAPVRGVVTLSGAPLESGQIVFESKTPGVSVTVPLSSGGQFEIKDYKGSGLPAGEYSVFFQAPPPPLPTAGSTDITMKPVDFLVPAKYQAAKTSGLTANVELGKESVPLKFDLVK